MLYVRRVGLAEGVAYPLKPPFFSSNKGSEWNNAAYEEKEKYHHFTHAVWDYTNSYPHFNKRERMKTWEMEETNTRSKKK